VSRRNSQSGLGAALPAAPVVILALAGAAAMLAVIGRAMMQGSFSAEGGELMAMPWGVVTLADVYVGLALFSGWVSWRERSRASAAAWIVAFVLAGNLATCSYVVKAVLESRRDARLFWMGLDSDAP